MANRRTNEQKTVRNRSKIGAGQLTRNTGMTLWEFRQRPGRAFNGKPPKFQFTGSVGLNTSGALSGLRASSFPNPVLAPPPQNKSCSPTRERSAFGSLSIGAGNIVITGDCEIYDKHF